MTSFTIRPARIEDCEAILALINELAAYENVLHEVVATQKDLEHTLFGNSRAAHALVGEAEDEIISIGIYYFSYSTWLGRAGLFLDDLYVTPQYRGIGAGKAMLQRLAKIAVKNNCQRFEWNVMDWNKPAIDFYNSIGAKPQTGWIGYRLSGDALNSLGREQR